MKIVEANNITDILDDAERNHWWFNGRRSIIEYVFWNKNNNKKTKVLSVGSSTGAELEHISRFASVVGIDIDKHAVEYCKQRNLNVIHDDILSSNLPSESFDIVVAMDVLEHIEDDKNALRIMCQLLKPGGKLLITVPACPFLWSKFDEIDHHPHYRRYTYLSLKTLLKEQKNIKIKFLSYYNFFLFPLMFIVRKIDWLVDTELSKPPVFINYLLTKIFSFERYFLHWGIFPIGGSLMATCYKKEK